MINSTELNRATHELDHLLFHNGVHNATGTFQAFGNCSQVSCSPRTERSREIRGRVTTISNLYTSQLGSLQTAQWKWVFKRYLSVDRARALHMSSGRLHNAQETMKAKAQG